MVYMYVYLNAQWICFNFLICGITDKIVITSFLVNKQVDQGL